MKPRYVLSRKAQSDLEEIWDYSAAQWGATQANQYASDLIVTIEAIASGKRAGRACEEIRPHYFKIQSGSHIIFYRKVNSKIEVVRILHQRMDFGRRL